MRHSRTTNRGSGARHSVALAGVAAAMLGPFASSLAVDDVTLRAVADSSAHEIGASIGTAVKTPIGRIDVTGHARLAYACDGALSGTVAYSRIVRLAAHIKHVTLVTSVTGSVSEAATWDCTFPRDSVFGHFSIAGTLVTGDVRIGDSVSAVNGVVVARTGKIYDAVVAPAGDRRGRGLTLTLR